MINLLKSVFCCFLKCIFRVTKKTISKSHIVFSVIDTKIPLTLSLSRKGRGDYSFSPPLTGGDEGEGELLAHVDSRSLLSGNDNKKGNALSKKSKTMCINAFPYVQLFFYATLTENKLDKFIFFLVLLILIININ